LHRIKKIFMYLLAARDFEALDRQEIYNMSYDSIGSKASTFDTYKVISQMVRREIERAGIGLHWLKKIMLQQVSLSATHVYNYLISCKYYSSLSYFPQIKEVTMNTILNIMNNKFETIERKWRDDIMIYSHQLREDIGVRSLIALVCGPSVNTILPLDKYFLKPVEVEKKNVPDHLKLGKIFEKLNRKEYTPNDKPKLKHETLIALMGVIFQSQELFNISDFVVGGHQQLTPVEREMIDESYIKSVAQEYYVATMYILIFNLESAINFHYIHFFGCDDDSTIVKKIDKAIKKIPLHDDEIDEKRLRLEVVEKEITELDKSLKEVRAAFKGIE